MTKEELLKRMRENEELVQNQFIDKLLEEVEFLCEKANRTTYEPTLHEKETFKKIVVIIDDMKQWF